jgi:D-alanyl-D-alanine carboxypeptidase
LQEITDARGPATGDGPVMRVAAVAALVLALSACGGSAARPDLQREVDMMVTGPHPAAPGLTAYVAGPRGAWSYAAGEANVAAHQKMEPDARLRLESVSKLWTATVIVKLASEGRLRLDDTVARWLPGLLPFGDRITIRQLLDHTSGLLDNNDVSQSPAQWFARVHDPTLHAELLRLARALTRDPAHRYDDLLEIRMAGAVGLLTKPGTSYHYSNIGYKVLGRIAERAGDAPLGTLYRRIIIDPLHLKSAAYDPAGPIDGEHPLGYIVERNDRFVEASNVGEGALGAEGGIVSDAKDEATFLVALVRGKIVPEPFLRQMFIGSPVDPSYGLGTGIASTCAGATYTHNGGGPAWASSVAVSSDGSRVAVLLLNGRRQVDEPAFAAAVFSLLCAA